MGTKKKNAINKHETQKTFFKERPKMDPLTITQLGHRNIQLIVLLIKVTDNTLLTSKQETSTVHIGIETRKQG